MTENRFAKYAPEGKNRFAKYAKPTATEYAQGGVGGFNRGLAGMAGFPVDVVNAGLSLVGLGTDRPIGGSRSIEQAMDGTLGRLTESGTMFPEGPDTAGGRIINRVGQEIGAAAIPAAGILRAGSGLAPAMRPAPTLGQTFLDPIRRSPGRAAIGETAAAAGAGAGAGIAREAAPGNQVAETYGQLIGGFTPSILANMPAAVAGRTVQAVRGKLSSEARKEAAKRTVGDYIGGEMTTQQIDNLRAADAIADQVPGFNPTLAERTGSPGLVKKQIDIESGMAGVEIDEAIRRRQGDSAAITRFGESAAPEPSVGPDLVVDTARRRVEDLRSGVERQANLTDAARRDLADSIPIADRAQEGSRLRGSLHERVGEEHASFEMIARESGLDDPGFIVPFAEFRDDILSAFNNATRLKLKDNAEGMPAPPWMIGRIQNAAEAQDFAALMELRSDISGNIRRAERMPSTDDTYLRGLKAMKSAFDNALEKAVQQTADPDIARRYREFRAAYLKRVVEPLKQNASHSVLHRDSQGAYVTPDERVVEAYFQKGAPTAAQQFKTVFRNDATANAAVEAVALDSLRRATVRDGVIDPRAFNNWMREYDSVLMEFKPIGRKIESIGRANAALVDRQRTLVRRERSVEDAILTRELRAVDRDSRNAAEAVARAMESPRKMATISRSVRGKPEAQAALRRTVWDSVADMPPGDLATYLDTNRSTLRLAGITNEHIDALRIIDGARTISSRTPAPTGSSATPDAVSSFVRTFGVRPDMLSNRLNALNTGRADRSWLVTNLMSNVLIRKQRQFDDAMWRAVLYDRELAKDLSQTFTIGRMGNAQANRLQARFFALGVPLVDGQEEQPE
jgi:hypothetical protein